MSPTTFATTICSLFFLLITDSSNKQCRDEMECTNQEITADIVECTAFDSCEGAQIVSNDVDNGYIACTAMSACEGTSRLSANNLYCTGFKSCYSSQVQSGEVIQCSGNSACDKSMAPSSSISADKLVYCGGKQACNEARVFSGHAVFCEGGQSCQSGAIQSANLVYCDAFEACSDNEVTAETLILCSGRGSCRGATLKSDEIRLYGIDSGAESEIYGASYIEAFGYQSLQNAKIYSSSQITVQVFGEESGKRAKFICQSGGECQLECKGNACQGLEFRCLPGSTCTVDPSQCEEEIYYDALYQGVTCPTITSGAPPNYQLSALNTELIPYIDDDDDVLADLHADDLKVSGFDVAVNTKSCGLELECDGATILNEEVVSCSGEQACTGSTIKNPGATSMEVVGCYGQSSCTHSILESPKGFISCKGEESCQFSDLVAKRIRCSGLNSCQNTKNIDASAPMECSGTSGCADITVFNLDTTACIANRACYMSTLRSRHGNILCDGHFSCTLGTLVSGGHIECNGKGSCHKTDITALNRVFANGDYAAQQATISASVVRAYGYRSLLYAMIDSEGRPTLTVNAVGHMAGFGATVLCRSSSECTLICKGSGCLKMKYICFVGATCNLQPNRCNAHSNNNNAVDGINCPELSTDVSPDDEHQIVKRQKYNMAADEIYKKYKKEISEDQELFAMLDAYKLNQDNQEDVVMVDNHLDDDDDDDEVVEEVADNEYLFEHEILSVVQSGLKLNDATQIVLVILAIGFIACLLYFGYKVKFAERNEFISLK